MSIFQTILNLFKALGTLLTAITVTASTTHKVRFARSESRIVDGVNVTPVNKYPMMVALVASDGLTSCSGTILNKYNVLTSAVCVLTVVKNGKENYRIVAGVYYYGDPDPRYLQKMSIDTLTMHTGAFDTTKGYSANDIGIIKVSSPFVWNDHVAPTNLPLACWDVLPNEEISAIAIGWGKGRNGYPYKPARPLQEVELPLLSSESCQRVLSEKPFNNHEICLEGINGAGPCWEDRGNPLFIFDEATEKHIQIGILIIFNGNCEVTSELYYSRWVKVSTYVHWIDEITRECDLPRKIKTQKGEA